MQLEDLHAWIEPGDEYPVPLVNCRGGTLVHVWDKSRVGLGTFCGVVGDGIVPSPAIVPHRVCRACRLKLLRRELADLG